MANHLHINDLPPGLTFGDIVAIDSEAMGLHPHRDRLCLVQMAIVTWCISRRPAIIQRPI